VPECATAEGDELATAAQAQRNSWLDEQLGALSAADRWEAVTIP